MSGTGEAALPLSAMLNLEPGSSSDRVAGGLVGLLVGDALGVPYEFNPPERIPTIDAIEFEPPAGFSPSHTGVPAGTWSDDGAQALCLLESLLDCGTLNLDDLGTRFIRWADEGHLAVDGDVFDIGTQTAWAFRALRLGTPPDRSGPDEEQCNGNGALMRVLPLVLWHQGTDSELVELASRQCLTTHGHPRSQVAAALYCLWARCELLDCRNPWDEAVVRLTQLWSEHSIFGAEVERVVAEENAYLVSGSGYVLDSLWSARHAVIHGRSFEEATRRAVALGDDTDTTAALAGGIAGIRYGYSGIPERWRERLRGGEIYLPLLNRLVSSHRQGFAS